MTATPYSISFLPPNSALNNYILTSQPCDQPNTIPATFRDAMTVRNEVFGKEQGVPMEYEWDEDDARSSHWVLYFTADSTDSKPIPIGTARAVPFPHSPHPDNGGRYFELGVIAIPPSPPSTEPPPYIIDRATTFHDGREAYIKLGRMAVLKEHRGKGLAKLLTTTVLQWLKENPTYFNPSLERVKFKHLGVEEGASIAVWKGLVCIHAQKLVEPAWVKLGFKTDEGMGVWYEADIPHVGMFQRLDV